MDRSKIPAAAFEWAWDAEFRWLTVTVYPVKRAECLEWIWSIDASGGGNMSAKLWNQAQKLLQDEYTGRNLSDTPQDALDSLSSEQMDALEKLIEWVQS